MADAAPPVGMQNHVDAAVPQPARLVEAVRRGARETHRRDGLDHGTLRRRAAQWKLEQHSLSEAEAAESAHLRGNSQFEARAPRRGRDGQLGSLGGVDAREELAAVERIEPGAYELSA